MSKPFELFVVGDFPNPYEKKPNPGKAKRDAIDAGAWEPDGDDLDLVAQQAGAHHGVRGGSSFPGRSAPRKKPEPGKKQEPDNPSCSNLYVLLGLIADRSPQPRSLSRLHVITHGDTDGVALAGEIELSKSGRTKPTVRLNSGGFDSVTLNEACHLKVPRAKPAIYMSTVRECFTKNAQIVLYACESGSAREGPDAPPSRELLDDISEVFGVQVLGFNAKIAYCPDSKRGEILVGVGECEGGTGVRDITRLVDIAAKNGKLVTSRKPTDPKFELEKCIERSR